jgi:hypothetical protein
VTVKKVLEHEGLDEKTPVGKASISFLAILGGVQQNILHS